MLWELNKLLYIKWSEQCLLHSKSSISMCYYYWGTSTGCACLATLPLILSNVSVFLWRPTPPPCHTMLAQFSVSMNCSQPPLGKRVGTGPKSGQSRLYRGPWILRRMSQKTVKIQSLWCHGLEQAFLKFLPGPPELVVLSKIWLTILPLSLLAIQSPLINSFLLKLAKIDFLCFCVNIMLNK